MDYLPAFLIAYSDSSFTNPHEVVLPDEPVDRTGRFTHMGAQYWGFETSRHRALSLPENSRVYHFDHYAYHWLHIGLRAKASVSRITVSTRWFTGNQVPEIAIELMNDHGITEVVARTALAPDQEHSFDIDETVADECLIRCFHEGGIARVSLFGETVGETEQRANLLEAATISHISNEHYGKPGDAVRGNREVDYMLGWESARTGFGEQALFHLARSASIDEIIVDTYLHRLNAPLSCHIFGLCEPDATRLDHHMALAPRWTITFSNGMTVCPDNFTTYMQEKKFLEEPVEDPVRFSIELDNQNPELWHPLVSFGRLRPDTWHRFREVEFREPVTHVLYMHYPNGGIHGLKVFGTG